MKPKDSKYGKIIEVSNEMENDHQINGSNVNMKDIAVELKFLEECLDNPKLEYENRSSNK